MFRLNNGQFRRTPPTTVVMDGYRQNFADLTRQQWDELGYNEAVAIRREPFTAYETEWVKGEDMIYREEIVSATVDEVGRAEAEATAIRVERDRLLATTDWTQLQDAPLDDAAMVLWQGYRQSLRDVPQQEGFPGAVEWPELPATE